MTKQAALGVLAVTVLVLLSVSSGQTVNPPNQEGVTSPQTAIPAFPPSERCSEFTPCRNLMGEVLRIEESYWIKQPNGTETRVHVTGNTNMKNLPKVGDKIAAQVDSTGDATAVVKIQEFPDPNRLKIPQKTHEELR